MRTELRQLKALFQFWMALFGFGALVFFVFPDRVIATLNQSAKFMSFLQPMRLAGDYFWLPLAVSLMVVLTFLCYLCVRDIENAQAYVLTVLLSKSTSSLVFFFFYIRAGFEAPFFWGSLTDGLIFLVTFWFYKRAVNSV